MVAVLEVVAVIFPASDVIDSARAEPNVIAGLRVIRSGESNQNDDAYTLLVGGGHFTDMGQHPRIAVWTAFGWSSAAGAFQIMARVDGKVRTGTWDDLIATYGESPFTPAAQDAAAIALIGRRGALDDLVSGRIQTMIEKCCHEWASLPGAGYGQPEQKLEKLLAVYVQYGGTEA